MNYVEAYQILKQVEYRYKRAETAYENRHMDEFDRELSELRDVLDDIYERPDEEG